MSDRFPDLLSPALDSSGNPISGAKLDFFITGTSTRKDTYTTSAKSVANANPVIADSAGRFPEIFMDTDAAYKITFSDADDVVIWTKDPVYPILPPGTFPIIAVSSKSSNYTVIASDRGADILVDASSGPATITLLPVVTAASGFVLTVVKTDSSANVVTVDGNLAETINGATTVGLGVQYDAIEIGTEATLWYIKSEKRLPTPQVANADEIVTVNAGGTGFITTTNPLPPGHLTGLTLSNNATDATNDIDIAVGKCRDTADTANVSITAAVGKQLDVSWSAGGTPGAPTGGLSSSLTLTNDTWYAAIAGLVSGTAEIGFDTSITGANLVTDHSFTNTRRIGWVRRETAANRLFTQLDDDILYTDADGYVSFTGNYTTTSTAVTTDIPTGEKMIAHIIGQMSVGAASNTYVFIRSPDVDDVLPTSVFHNLGANDGGGAAIIATEMHLRTDTSAQLFHRSSVTRAGNIYTRGYRDRRGRDG